MDIEQFKQFTEMQRALGGNQWFSAQNVGMIVTALCSLIAAITVWINKRATEDVKEVVKEVKDANIEQTKVLSQVHTEVNSKTAALLAKFEAQENMIREMTKKIATLEEREQVSKMDTAVAEATAKHEAKKPVEEATGELKKAAATLDQYHTVVGGPKGEPGDPALRTTK